MKLYKIAIGFVFFFTAFMFNSCETEPIDPAVLDNINNPENPNNTAGFFKVDFNGGTYVATTRTAIIDNGVILIGGSRGNNGENIGIILDGTTTGNYTDSAIISYNPSAASEFDYVNLDADFISNGIVVITEINTTTKIISGTFNFTGNWSDYDDANAPTSIAFTNGSFSIPYTTNSPDPDPDPLQGTFTVAIDEVPFVANSIIAVQSEAIDPATNLPLINPETNLPFVSYSIAGKYNETKIVTIQFIETSENVYDIPDGGLITYIPNALNPAETFVGNNFSTLETVGNITITSNNTTTRKISGTFKCIVSLIDFNTGEVTATKQLTNGVLTDVYYTID